MSELRDYEQWHLDYDDPASSLSWRLRAVQRFIEQAIDRHAGPIRVVSSCSGEGRDLLGVLSRRDDAARVKATLLEVHPAIAERARAGAAGCTAEIDVRTTDAGVSDAYVDLVPADLVIMVGIFGNISDEDIAATIAAAPQLCRPGGTLLWSRGRFDGGDNAAVRAWFAEAGFTELDYATRDDDTAPAAGAVRYDGAAQPLVRGRRLFTFRR